MCCVSELQSKLAEKDFERYSKGELESLRNVLLDAQEGVRVY